MSDAVDTLRHFDDFEPHAGSTFTIGDQAGSVVALRLAEVTELREYRRNAETRMPFSLLFEAGDVRMTEQGLYRMNHPVMGELVIFLVPVARGETGLLFEATFN